MISPAKVAFDIDGVVADTMHLFLDIARREFHVNNIEYEDITSYDLRECLDMDMDIMWAIIDQIIYGSHKFPLKPIQGACDVLTRIGEKQKVLFVTARPSPDFIKAWLLDKLPLDPSFVEIVATGDFDTKSEVLLDRGISYFVEDRLETCFNLGKHGINPVVFRQPWNRKPHPFTEVGSWEELNVLINFYDGENG
ncbi:Haloacid dehalogenase [Candidatus Magnetomoraceae bacterium gMMP-15]